ncbi:Peptidase S8 and S53, subtilisin, kexin, sedolisin [Trichormus variabilis ATCC 29413]|uniref:Peptidase S8 and S53, subtilisin, kexin, sedolisin n=2 Tax=Anabaena variabilis TaxID=264691 RepID=Q3M5S2_TRIV2|nr:MULTISPECIES: S8 family serine peptidase [Nostocaceae]ABA23664.1 Peptidase S8 and S53, subtilisin, kexin, sedolisin [Trichormus variabilis ATCC 29413]MBC1216451.1 S8 family serine peptidase [Trichormus variabilis ARAD]MBC1266108.1 S8 family serine peptidase [Trichormus variabilis FSR]MBC1304733.1 S8 family serine peptidase [Trichormus variabilis N2B]MBC1313453.1 S8 family serine peptidase [Trichormus variabilis PNB]
MQVKFTPINNNIIHGVTSNGNSFPEHNDAYSSELRIDDILSSNFHSSFSTQQDNTLLSATVSNTNTHLTAQTIDVTSSQPDLIIQNAVVPSTASIGTTIQVNYVVKNQGSENTFSSYTMFFLSRDRNVSDDDYYLGSDYVDGIAAGAYSSESSTLRIDNGIVAGSYYLLCQADGNGDFIESNETNNILATAININLIQTDLVVQNPVAPSSVTVGYSFRISYRVKNQSVGNAFPSSTMFYISKDKTISNDDLYLGSQDVGSIPAGAYSSQTTSLRIVNNITAGKYYLLYKADGNNNLIETNEGNNIVAKAINIKNSFRSTNGYGLINAAAAVAQALGQTTFGDVVNLGGNNWGADLINAPEVWAKGYTGQGITVAVVDGGVDRNHTDLSSNIWKNLKEIAGNGKDDDGNGYIDDVYGWNFVDNNNNTLDKNGHGTHVAGTIAGVRNSFGVTGIAYNAKIMPVKVLADNGSGADNAIAQGIRYAANNGANVINLSLGKEQPSINIQSAIQYASSKGAIVVMAAGNGGQLTPYYPARYATDWGLAVGAVDKSGIMASFSNLAGNELLSYVTAPGVGIYSTLPGNKYASWNGTSMSTPYVAGVVALMLSANKNLTDSLVRQILTSTAANR